MHRHYEEVARELSLEGLEEPPRFQHTVLVEIPRAAVARVDQSALRSVGAAIDQVRHTVAVRIGGAAGAPAAAEHPGQTGAQVLIVVDVEPLVLGRELGAQRHVRQEAHADAPAQRDRIAPHVPLLVRPEFRVRGVGHQAVTENDVRLQAAPDVSRVDHEPEVVRVGSERARRLDEEDRRIVEKRAVLVLQVRVGGGPVLKLQLVRRLPVPAEAQSVLVDVVDAQLFRVESASEQEAGLPGALLFFRQGGSGEERRDEERRRNHPDHRPSSHPRRPRTDMQSRTPGAQELCLRGIRAMNSWAT